MGDRGGREMHILKYLVDLVGVHEIAHFTEESGPSRTRVIGLLCELFVQYQSVVDSNGRLRPPSSHKVISGIFSL